MKLGLGVLEPVQRFGRVRDQREPEACRNADDLKCDDGVTHRQRIDPIIGSKSDDQRPGELVLQRESCQGAIALPDLMATGGANLRADVLAFVADGATWTGLGQKHVTS